MLLGAHGCLWEELIKRKVSVMACHDRFNKIIEMPYIVILLFFLCSCSPQRSQFDFPNVEQGNVDKIFETFVSIPLEMEKRGDMIFVSDFKGDSLLWCYNLNDSNNVKRLLPRGEGPDEFLSPVQFFLSDTTMFVYNRWHFWGKEYGFDSNKLSMKPLSTTVHYSTDIDMIYPLAENHWIASGRFEDCRFLIMDDKGNIVYRGGDYPDYNEGEEDIPNFPKFMFHQSMFGFNRLTSRLVSVTSHVFELWKYSDGKLSLYKRELLSPYKYKYGAGEEWASAVADENTETGVKRIYATQNNIYMLYDSNTPQMYRDKKDIFNSEIWVFDWDGKPIRKIKTDSRLICFCIDEKGEYIYCMLNAPDLLLER